MSDTSKGGTNCECVHYGMSVRTSDVRVRVCVYACVCVCVRVCAKA